MFLYPPRVIQTFYPSLNWKIKNAVNEVYLTFDDGPTPGVTDRVLDKLGEVNAKATFFCVGKNVENHSNLFQRIIEEGHAVGNHTYGHLNGWKTRTIDYLKDVERGEEVFQSVLFRPPYGKIKPSQISYLKQAYGIVMWSVLSMDFDSRKSKEQCWKITTKKLNPGGIIVLHDSKKAEERMIYVLEQLLSLGKKKGWQFRPIERELLIPAV